MNLSETTLFALTALLFASCLSDQAGKEVLVESKPLVTIGVNVVSERAVGPTAIMVFNAADGSLDAYAESESGNVSELRVREGAVMDCFAVVNAPDKAFRGIRNLDDFLAERSFLGENAPERLVCVGHCPLTSSSDSLQIRVAPTVSRVMVQAIHPEFRKLLPPETPVSIRRVFILNACGSVAYGYLFSPEDYDRPETWYNSTSPGYSAPTGMPDPDVEQLICRELDVEVRDTSRIRAGLDFFCCPNSWKDGRRTGLAVEVEVGDETMYYVVELPLIEAGREYCVNNLFLRSFGSASADCPASREIAECFVTVEDWNEENGTAGFGRTK